MKSVAYWEEEHRKAEEALYLLPSPPDLPRKPELRGRTQGLRRELLERYETRREAYWAYQAKVAKCRARLSYSRAQIDRLLGRTCYDRLREGGLEISARLCPDERGPG